MRGVNLFLVSVLMIMLIGLSSAAVETLKSAKLNQEYQIIQVCQDATYVNISLSNLNGNIFVNQQMTLNGTQWEYDFTPTQTGRHDATFLSDGCQGDQGRAAVYFEVTGSGLIRTTGYYILILFLSIGIIVLGYYVQDAWIVVLGSFAMVLFGLYVLFFGLDGIKDPVYTWGIGIITLMVGIYFGIKGTLEKIDN